MTIEAQYGPKVAALDRRFSCLWRARYPDSVSLREKDKLMTECMAIVAEMRRLIRQT